MAVNNLEPIMHMADALISPLVGGVMWSTAVGAIGYSAHKTKTDLDDRKIPLMGVLGAFIFATQMINFTIPGTGSSGHLGGGMILAILIGPYGALLTMASVLVIQALIFADGGLLALGCNIFNLGVIPCFIAFPLVYRTLVGHRPTGYRILLGSIFAAILGLQLGALGVVVETVSSGIAALPFGAFIFFMQPIHLAIGIVEGVVTAAVVAFVWKVRPELLGRRTSSTSPDDLPIRNVLVGFLVAALILVGALSWFASSHPDGLEWAISQVIGTEELEAPRTGIHERLAKMQGKTALLPDYGQAPVDNTTDKVKGLPPDDPSDTPLAGLVGGGLTLLFALLIGILCRKRTD